jgi:hypothetical protein
VAEYEKKVRDILSRNKCTFIRRGKGDHDIWYSPLTNQNITVDHKGHVENCPLRLAMPRHRRLFASAALVRLTGEHAIFNTSDKIKSRHTANVIMKKSGINHHF